MAVTGSLREKLPEVQVTHHGTRPHVHLKGTTDPKVLVEAIFASPKTLNLLQSAFTSKSIGASDSVGVLKAPVMSSNAH